MSSMMGGGEGAGTGGVNAQPTASYGGGQAVTNYLANSAQQFFGNQQSPEIARAGLSSPLGGGVEILGPGQSPGTLQAGSGLVGGLLGQSGFGQSNGGMSGNLGALLGQLLNQKTKGFPALASSALGLSGTGTGSILDAFPNIKAAVQNVGANWQEPQLQSGFVQNYIGGMTGGLVGGAG